MGTTSDEVIERTKAREVEGVFHSREALEVTVEALMLAGVDRTDIDALANLDEVSKSPEAPPAPRTSRTPHVSSKNRWSYPKMSACCRRARGRQSGRSAEDLNAS